MGKLEASDPAAGLPDQPGDTDPAACLVADAVLGRSGHASLSRLLSHASTERFRRGATIYRADTTAAYFYLLTDGAVALVSRQGRRCELSANRFGEEAGAGLPHYLTDALATSATGVVRLPRAAMRTLAEANPELVADLMLSLTSHLAGENLLHHPAPVERGPAERDPAERGAAERGPAERGAAERGPAERGLTEYGAVKRGPVERGTAERGAAERGPAERGPAERGPAERGAAERGPAERGLTEYGAVKRGPAESGPAAPERSTVPRWLLAIALPLLLLACGERLGVGAAGVMFLAIVCATVIMWVCNLTDDYIPALFAMLATLLTGLVPAPVILSGFASDGFLMALSTLALGSLVMSSGLGYRVMLVLLQRLPNTHFWHNAGLLMTGLLLTPVIPTANGRVGLLAPCYADMVDNLGLSRRGPAATCLALTCLHGASLFSAIFITSKSVNFAVFALLSPQGQERFQSMGWTGAALVTGAVLLALHCLTVAIWCRRGPPPRLPRARLARQRALLGALTGREWGAIGGVLFMMVGIVTTSVHKVQAPWLGFTVLFGLLLCGTLSRRELKEKVDWTILLYLSGITGMVAAFGYLGLDRGLGAHLSFLAAGMREHFGWFVLLLFGVVTLLRLVVPSNATTVILATVLMPLAQASGINEWLVGFIILVLSEACFFPYQCSYYLQLQELNRGDALYDGSMLLRINALMNLGRLAAVYAAFPYWTGMGLL